jgi:hypothetical protein
VSRAGRGTTLTVTLPIRTDVSVVPEPPDTNPVLEPAG